MYLQNAQRQIYYRALQIGMIRKKSNLNTLFEIKKKCFFKVANKKLKVLNAFLRLKLYIADKYALRFHSNTLPII